MKAGASCMWASCCVVLNEVMGTGAVRGQHAGFGGSTGPFRFTPAGFSSSSSSSSSSTPLCQSCRQVFSVFRRRHVCCDCRNSFCSLCSVLHDNLRRCTTCHLLWGTAFQRLRLMRLRVKDLRQYLTLRDINTDTCREKEDLVDLVLRHQGAESEERSPTADPASSHGDPISRSASSGSTNQDVGDPTSLFNPEPAEHPLQGRRPARASLSDVSSQEDLERLTVRQLKEILARNFVSFSGCCEKWELVERVRRLYRDNEENEKTTIGTLSSNNDSLCRICMDGVIDCVLLECGHMVTCTKCGKRMNECPICRQYVVRAVHVFRS